MTRPGPQATAETLHAINALATAIGDTPAGSRGNREVAADIMHHLETAGWRIGRIPPPPRIVVTDAPAAVTEPMPC